MANDAADNVVSCSSKIENFPLGRASILKSQRMPEKCQFQRKNSSEGPHKIDSVMQQRRADRPVVHDDIPPSIEHENPNQQGRDSSSI